MSPIVWFFFLLFVLAVVALDLGVFHRRDEAPTTRDALAWTMVWITLALAFNGLVWVLYENNYPWASVATEHLSGRQAATQFLLGYVLEKSLSVDNIFVIAMIFSYFRVPLALQHRVLFWGILGAVVLRGIMIGLGAVLIHKFEWIIYVFGALLLYTALRMVVIRHDNLEPEENALVRLARRWLPVTRHFHGRHFIVVQNGKRMITPLFLALLMVESSDIMFAVDSIPAIFAVTQDPFIVFTSNIFAILGLRSLYFVLAGLMEQFRYLKSALVFVLVFIGIKMLISKQVHIPEAVSLSVVLGMLAFGLLASMFASKKDTAPLRSPLKSDTDADPDN